MSYDLESVEEVLAHFGVKGMRWGVRRLSPPGSSDHETARIIKEKTKRRGTKDLSNEELEILVKRMNLEQQFSRLEESRVSTLGRGQKVVKGILTAGRTMNDVMSFINSPVGKAIRSSLIKSR